MDSHNKNLLLACALSIMILVGYETFFSPAARLPSPPSQKPFETPVPPLPPNAVKPHTPKVHNIPLTSDSIEGILSTKGGRITSLSLKGYAKSLKDSSHIEVIKKDAYMETGFQSPSSQVPDAHTLWQTEDKQLTPFSPVTLVWENEQGVMFKRTYSIDQHFKITLSETLTNNSQSPIDISWWGQIVRHSPPVKDDIIILHQGALSYINGHFKETNYKDMVTPQHKQGDGNSWLGITDKYWLTAMGIQNLPVKITLSSYGPKGRDYCQLVLQGPTKTLAQGETHRYDTNMFAGAKDTEILKIYHQKGFPLIEKSIDWGWFYFLTRPLFHILMIFYSLVGNFGLAIIMLTLIIKLLFLPLTYKSMKAMRGMKELQPQMQTLRERYASDKVQLQKEMMKLYKASNFSPAAGCLPIFLQIPVFFALYKVLFISLQLRHAPFFGWIEDLSAPDPLTPLNLFGLLEFTPPTFLHIGLWPLFMGFGMWLQMRLSPQSLNPLQARIMSFLPILFIFLLARFPSGLVIYWTISTAFSILQQLLFNWRFNSS